MKFNINVKASIKSLTEGIVFFIDNLERLAIVIVSRIAPWAAPLAPAYFVARTVQKHFEAPLWVAIAVGITLEAVGIAATHITLEMYQYNQSRRKTDPAAPFDVGLLVASAYFIVGISLTVILELFPDLVVIAPTAFFLLAIVAYMSLALMSGHARRLQGIDQEKQNRKQKRHPGGTKPELPTGTWKEPGTKTKSRARAILAERPDISGSELGRQLGRSERLGRRLKAELSGNGSAPAGDAVETEFEEIE